MLVQFTLTTSFLGIAGGQLVVGTLSDQLGRRPVLLAALGAFAVASIVLVFVPDIVTFTIIRAIQGLTGAAGSCSRGRSLRTS
ncbi:MAG: MFS transporter [Salinibacterium sp.]|nr:MFS transporter [Salinibacterium sp.]